MILLIFAMLIDAALGEPKQIWDRYPHPAVLMGRAVEWLDQRLNIGAWQKAKGIAAMAVLAVGAIALGLLIHLIPDYGLLECLTIAVLLAQRSLVDHVKAVADGLRMSLEEGRRAVAMIVGRDTAQLDHPGVARAAIESAAENFSDGVVAPIFWYVVAGLPGLLLYKITNTADSMIGHRTPRHEQFGWAAARFDDLLNLIPARLSAAMIALAHFNTNYKPILRDAPLHRSPNAGWPEAAMAMVLNVALSGPRSYNGVRQDFPWVYPEGLSTIDEAEVDSAVLALWRSWVAVLLGVVVLSIVI